VFFCSSGKPDCNRILDSNESLGADASIMLDIGEITSFILL